MRQQRLFRRTCLLLTVSLLAALLIPGPSPGHTQEDDTLLVSFVTGSVRTASPDTIGVGGASELGVIFQQLGAQTTLIDLKSEVSDDVDVVVIAGAVRELSLVQLARLWVYMRQGGNVLLMVDPQRPAIDNVNNSDSGISTLFNRNYGIGLEDAYIVQEWFTNEVIAENDTTFSKVYPDIFAHPVIEPLTTYDLPVITWGARPIYVDPFGPDGFAVPLIRTIYGYGETADILNTSKPDPLELDAEEDITDLLNVGALVEDEKTGARFAVFGDAQMFLNGYGMRRSSFDNAPFFAGNYVLATRLAGWLLHLPVEEWPGLPTALTWLAIDGDPSDWFREIGVGTDESGDAPSSEGDITRIRSFRNEDYFYLLIETEAPAPAGASLRVIMDADADGTTDVVFNIEGEDVNAVINNTRYDVFDARSGFGAALEVRLPLRLAGQSGQMDEICLFDAQSNLIDCMNNLPQVLFVQERAPSTVDLLPNGGPLVQIETVETANVRETPSANSRIVTFYPNGTIFAAVGRTEEGDWIKIQDAGYEGWIATFLLHANSDLLALPVVEE